MKTKIFILILLFAVLFTLSIILIHPFFNGDFKKTVANSKTEDHYKTLTYIITEVDGNQYFGESVDGQSKIQFHRDDVKHPITDSIKVNDKILAYVESENHIAGIVKVEKIE
ncbi:hypothetical protein [Metabacillus schmidteae]|uniref:hypothetical protein n=1 Tax=Metabacillus schmidteae TaxID=2730405 RepID=UPI00158BA300|nr:hypothetical protein [Metabacillus schmidteae]